MNLREIFSNGCSGTSVGLQFGLGGGAKAKILLYAKKTRSPEYI